MSRSIAFAPAAQMDLADAVAWHTQPGAGAAAERRLTALQLGLSGLLTHPYRGRRMDQVGRIVVIAGFRIIYRIFPDTGYGDTAGDVTVMRILGPGQNN